MASQASYEALEPATLGARLRDVPGLAERVGGAPETWQVREVGDGNLNLVFIIEGPAGQVVVKQALPYVRLVGDSWPLPLYRAFYEFHALDRQARRDPGAVPEIFHFDEAQALIVMEYLSPHRILRHKLIAGERVEGLAARIGAFCARTAFRGSELSMASAEKKADVALFAGNVEIPAITEDLVFTDPYYAAEKNHHTPGLDAVVARLREHVALKARVQRMLMRFASNTETLLHGDLHSGSIMATADAVRVIDPEFAQYGPMGFDIGMLTANYLMSYFSQPGHRGADLDSYQEWLLEVIEGTFAAFETEFARLWDTERTGMLYPRCLFEAQGHGSAPARAALLREVWQDALTVCGIEMHRRVLSLAHNADFESIADPALRAPLEARNLMMGRELILGAETIPDAVALCAMARRYNGACVT
ncbi:S-methyl-5-thioribose kinase [Limimaricola pyoseonensis]|nr:S-methyl-5-thioribose kinase [Limimaricola pyoseonensis]